MIRAKNLSKSYNGKYAVEDLSFEVGPREVVGFLGANGAGKTTTLRMLSGYLSPTSGTAIVAGHDITRESMQARRKLGYLPENAPLYEEMRVQDYLRFRAHLKGLRGRQMKMQVAEAMERCSIDSVRKRSIQNLSKGYRQRLGLSDAILARPSLLILDEPTNGLDPLQIREIRDLIRELGQDCSILLSTHILSEVEKLCDRVIIIDQGKKRGSGTPAGLIANHRTAGKIHLQVKAPIEGSIPVNAWQALDALLESIPEVRKISQHSEENGWHHCELIVGADYENGENITHHLTQAGWQLREISRAQIGLEEAFVEITSEPMPAA